MQTPQPSTLAAIRDRLDWMSLNGEADALERRTPCPPANLHRAERRAYFNGYHATLRAITIYARGGQ